MAFKITKPADEECLLALDYEQVLKANEPARNWEITTPFASLDLGIGCATGEFSCRVRKTGTFVVKVRAESEESGETDEISWTIDAKTLNFQRRPGIPGFEKVVTLFNGSPFVLDFLNNFSYTPETLEQFEFCKQEDEENASLELHV